MSGMIRSMVVSLFACLTCAQLAVAAPIILPPPISPYAVQYDDFFSYSAKILTELGFAGYDISTGTGGLDLIIYTGAGGANNLNVGIAPNDNYDFPDPLDAPGGGTTTFSGVWGPNDVPPGPIPVDYLLAYLNDTFGPDVNIPVFNFDMNQTGNDPDLEVVGEVRIVDPNNANAVVANWTFDNLTNGVFDPTAWVLSPGEITIPDPNNPGQFITVNNNTGSGKLDFVVYAPTMNLALYTGQGYNIEFDFRMQGLNDGFEELFLTGQFQPAPIPEPGTMMLMGLGGLGAAFMRRRRGQKA